MLHPSKQEQFSLDQFHGPVDLLLYLVQKSELDVSDIPLCELTTQFVKRLEKCSLDQGGEFAVAASSLLLLKSRALLGEKRSNEPIEEDPDPGFEMLSQVVEYCRFRQAAKGLSRLEDKQQTFFPKGRAEEVDEPQHSGLARLTLDDLADRLHEVLEQAKTRAPKVLHAEEWSVIEAIKWIQRNLEIEEQLPFERVFSEDKCRDHLIVLFLATLELMKGGELAVSENLETGEVFLHGQ